MEQSAGFGGGVRVKYAQAAVLGRWTLTVVGPNLYKLRAEVQKQVPPWLALDGTVLWIRKGNLAWEWAVSDLRVVDGVMEAVVGVPKLGPLPAAS